MCREVYINMCVGFLPRTGSSIKIEPRPAMEPEMREQRNNASLALYNQTH